MTRKDPADDGYTLGQGRVVSVHRRATPSDATIAKPAVEHIEIGPWGVQGDYHAGRWTVHGSGKKRPNHRMVTIVSAELIAWIARQIGIQLRPGDLGENIHVVGLGDLTRMRPDDRLVFASGVVLRITGQNQPCRKLDGYHPALKTLLRNRRGVLAVVERTGRIRPGMSVLWQRGRGQPDG